MNKHSLLFLLLISFSACFSQKLKSKPEFQYELNLYKEAKPGVIVKNEIIGKADTTLVVITGQVLSKNEDVPFANISFVNSKNESIGTQSDIEGHFKLVLHPGLYKVKFFCSGFNKITLENVLLVSGDMREIVVDLGILGGFHTYYLKSTKELTPEELKAEEAKRSVD